MTDRRSDTRLSAIVESHGTQVAQRQLQFALALLACHLARYRTVHLVGQPVLASYRLQLEHILQIMVQFRFFIDHRLVGFHHRMVAHDRTRGFPEHIFQLDVDRFHPVSLFEDKLHVVGCFPHDIHRSPFPLSHPANTVHILFLHQQAHTLLALVPDNFLSRQRRVANRELAHIDMSAGRLHQLREAVQVSARSMVVNRHDRIFI